MTWALLVWAFWGLPVVLAARLGWLMCHANAEVISDEEGILASVLFILVPVYLALVVQW